MPNEKKLNILMFNMSAYSDWQKGVSNRNRQIFEQLLVNEKVNKILAVDFLPHTYKRATRILKDDILAKGKLPILKKSFFSKTIYTGDKLMIHSSIWPVFSLSKFYQDLKKLAESYFDDDYIIWSFYPLTTGYFDSLPAKLKIFDAVDNWAEHPSLAKFKKRLNDNYKIIDQKADIIFTVSEELQKLFSRKEIIHWLPNGVDLKHFQKHYPIINRDIGHISHPILGYIGTIQDRLDTDLLAYLAKSNPEKSFVLVGPVWHKKISDALGAYRNIHFLGRKSYEESPMYIQHFDLGIIPHKVDNFLKSTNPMKIFDYLACGKAVVSTQGVGLPEFSEHVCVEADWQMFNLAVNNSLRDDSDFLRQQRINLVKDHTWLKRAERMLEIIQQKL
ncbi:MAG: glycosyltransferase [Candidatus Komeilibacteria bacterium]|nr:glycosyltransferase [Candidatus Komeilibacteria bacterium]